MTYNLYNIQESFNIFEWDYELTEFLITSLKRI